MRGFDREKLSQILSDGIDEMDLPLWAAQREQLRALSAIDPPRDLWARTRAAVDAPMLLATAQALKGFAGHVLDRRIGDVPVIEMHPATKTPARGAVV